MEIYPQRERIYDVLGPLRGYILKQVGRPWDKEHSEIKQVLKGGCISALHAQNHLFQMVSQDVVEVINKIPYNARGQALSGYGRNYHSISKRQLDSQEVKKAGLK